MLTDGLHPLVSAVLKNNKMIVVAGLAADVRLACDHLMKRSSNPLQIHHIDHWTTGRADNKPYRFARSSIEILTTYKLEFKVHHASPTSAPKSRSCCFAFLCHPYHRGLEGDSGRHFDRGFRLDSDMQK